MVRLPGVPVGRIVGVKNEVAGGFAWNTVECFGGMRSGASDERRWGKAKEARGNFENGEGVEGGIRRTLETVLEGKRREFKGKQPYLAVVDNCGLWCAHDLYP